MLFILVLLAMKPTRGQRASTPRQETWCAARAGVGLEETGLGQAQNDGRNPNKDVSMD
jgi:hypothetical protein